MRTFSTVGVALASLLIATAAWVGLIRASRPSVSATWTHGLYLRKEAAAARLPEHRVVVIGGSGAHYGFSGQEVTRLTGLPTVNLGTHAGLGMSYLVYHAKRVLRPGDFAVLAIEPNLYFPDRPSKVLAEYVLHYDLGYLLHSGVSDATAILAGLGPSDMIEESARVAIPWRSQTGRAETVNEYGDETLVLSRIQTPAMRAAIETSAPMPAWRIDVAKPPQSLLDFFHWARAHGIRFGLAWTPMVDRPDYRSPAYQATYSNIGRWYTDNGGVLLGIANSYFQPTGNMFDYALHDNEKGRIAASHALALGLCDHLPCSRISSDN